MQRVHKIAPFGQCIFGSGGAFKGRVLSFTAEPLMVRFIPSSFKVNVVTRPRQILVIEVAGPCGQIRPGQIDDRVK
jgi:hypothetical protein